VTAVLPIIGRSSGDPVETGRRMMVADDEPGDERQRIHRRGPGTIEAGEQIHEAVVSQYAGEDRVTPGRA